MQPAASFAEDLDGFSGDDLVVADPANTSLDVMFHYGFGRFDEGARYYVAANPTAVTGGRFRSGVPRPMWRWPAPETGARPGPYRSSSTTALAVSRCRRS